MEISQKDLSKVATDIERLSKYEDNAEIDLANVENLEFWKPTKYEKFFLPRLRLCGIRNKNIILQNTADLHIHTHYSDGDDLHKVLKAAEDQELNAIAITDHDKIEGALEARRIVHKRRLKFAVVPGTEVSSKDGHIGALFVMKKIPSGLSARETVKLIHKAGGIAVAHHPYVPRFMEFLLREKIACRDLIKAINFDAVECTNAVPGYGARFNLSAIESMKKNNIRVAVTGSSDAHYAGFVGKGRTYYAGNFGVQSLYDNLKLGYTRGAECYWRFSEKILYRYLLAKGIYRKFSKIWKDKK